MGLRREAEARHGASLVLDPTAANVAMEIKTQTDTIGVDVPMKTSGSSRALNDALRAVKYSGMVVSSAYYKGPMDGLLMSGEWHRNRIQLVSSRSDSDPNPDFGWDLRRIQREDTRLVIEGRLKADGLVDPNVPMSKSAETYMLMNSNPQQGIKMGVDHTLSG